MSLELRKVQIKDVVLGEVNRLADGILLIDTGELETLILEDHRIRSVSFDIARPGESVRILPVKDVIEPRAKLEGGSAFPGMLSEKMTAGGKGITYALKGCVVTTTGPIVGFQEGLIDMTGPGADFTIFSKYINIVMIIDKHDDVNPHEHEEVVRVAGVKAANYIGQIALDCQEYEKTVYEWPSIGERYAMYPELPKVAYVCNCMSQGLLHDTYFYGRDTKKLVPTMVSPLEFMDGALVSGNCVSPGSKTTTFHHLNNAVIDELFRRHGKEFNFVGLVLNPMMVTLKEKYRGAMLVAELVESLGVEAAIITQEGFGNPTTDLMMACKNIEEKGIKTVIVTNEDAGTDGMSESLPDMVKEADAIVTTGNSNATILLPKVDRVIGKLEDIERVTGGNVDSIKPDGTLLVEIHGIMGSHNLQGNTLLTAVTV
ncbi:MAG: glycine/sarcosine/betaine reductase component B subunit [Eubacteriales bacterium]|nr:glycine/sarcosine/betaine reductase component B subunit [Eubacteriales bacterium]MDD4286694.1 glycine/sarcosine/betaine reductase component B subunit [Eubacteriales bacterium]NLV69345.1 beta-aspartyl-peptidase [Clostridiales bacterium]HPF18105.1 glycine/sarcosine/betaine reductase component B subunit [Bacillota bacterium]